MKRQAFTHFAILLALILAFAMPPACAEAKQPTATATVQPAEAGESTETQIQPVEAGEDVATEIQPAKAYVLVSTATQIGFLPLPEEGEVSYPLTQLLPDGTEATNVIHLTPDGVYMEDSTCENHDCVNQGTVTLENRNDRILSNMIICLPNQVWLQLLTPEEILEMVKGE